MKCSECQNEMTKSHKGYLCLHCGHIESTSPHDIPLTPTDAPSTAISSVLPAAPPIRPLDAKIEPSQSLISTHTSTHLDSSHASVEAVSPEILGTPSMTSESQSDGAAAASLAASIAEATLEQQLTSESSPSVLPAAEPASSFVQSTAEISQEGSPATPAQGSTEGPTSQASGMEAPDSSQSTQLPVDAAPTEPTLPPTQPEVTAEETTLIEPTVADIPVLLAPQDIPAQADVLPQQISPAIETTTDLDSSTPSPVLPQPPDTLQRLSPPLAISLNPKVVDGLAAKPKPIAPDLSTLAPPPLQTAQTILTAVQAETHPNEISGGMVATVIALCVITLGGLGTAGYIFIIH
jgi:hypothetical protein